MNYIVNTHKNYPDLRILAETPALLLGHYFEEAILILKRNGEYLLENDFYGDPTCGCISPTNDWAVVAGEHLAIWRKGKGVTIVAATAELRDIHALRLAGATYVELLTNPWSTHAAVWQLNIRDLSVHKVKDFPDYQGKEYVEDEQVEW